jgi:hypothetical protein
VRIRREPFQGVLGQEQTHDHGHFVGGAVYPQAFVPATAKADEGKAVLALFRTLWGKAPRLIARGLGKGLGEPMGQGRR